MSRALRGFIQTTHIVNIIRAMVQAGIDSSALNQSVSHRAPEIQSTLTRGFSEIFGGARGISKMSHLWLPLSVLLISDSAMDLKTYPYRSLPLILAVFFRVQFSILANDLSDRQIDLTIGKNRWIGNLPRPVGFLVVLACLAFGLVAVILWSGSIGTTLAYVASALLAIAYSQKPFRFKERGILGLIVYALSSILIYVLVPWMWFNAEPWSLLFLVAAVGSDKWIQLHFHQIIDYPADLKTGTQTYAVQAGLIRARSSLKMASLITSLCLAAMTAYIAVIAGRAVVFIFVLIALIAGMILSRIYIAEMKKQKVCSSTLVRELPWFYLGLTFIVFYALPLILFFFAAWQEPRMWILVAVALFFLASMSMQSHRYQYK